VIKKQNNTESIETKSKNIYNCNKEVIDGRKKENSGFGLQKLGKRSNRKT
jgi:hypothetical protein